MRDLRVLGSAMWREIYARWKAFLISTGIIVALVLGGMVTISATLDEGPPIIGVGVVGEAPSGLEAAIEGNLDEEALLELDVFENRRIGEEALTDGELSALVVGPRDILWHHETPAWVTEAVAGAVRMIYVQEVAADLGLDDDALGRLLAPVRGETFTTGDRDTAVEVVSTVAVILMFLAIIAYGQWIAYGVVEEKASRVAELILGTLSPSQLLGAKVVTLGGLGLLQLALVGTTAVVAGSSLVEIGLPPIAGSTLAWLVLWFLLGFAFYGTLYAAAGSLAADTQEAGNAIGPLNILPTIGYMAGIIGFASGSEIVPRVLSMIPLWAPMVMPARMGRGMVPTWEIAVSGIVMAVSIALMLRFAARVYLGGITQATRSVGWIQAFRGGRDYRAP